MLLRVRDQGGDSWFCLDTLIDTREDGVDSWFEAHDGERGVQWGVILVGGMDRMGKDAEPGRK